MNARKCTVILANILYLRNMGEVLCTTKVTESFFAIAKLFQAKDTVLWRLVYLGIKVKKLFKLELKATVSC